MDRDAVALDVAVGVGLACPHLRLSVSRRCAGDRHRRSAGHEARHLVGVRLRTARPARRRGRAPRSGPRPRRTPVIDAANSSRPALMSGAAQNATMKPTYSGCRTRLVEARLTWNAGLDVPAPTATGRGPASGRTCRSGRSGTCSTTTIAQPAAKSDPQQPAGPLRADRPDQVRQRPPLPRAAARGPRWREHVGAALDARRDDPGPHPLEPGRAITLCCSAKTAHQGEVDGDGERGRARRRRRRSPSGRRCRRRTRSGR